VETIEPMHMQSLSPLQNLPDPCFAAAGDCSLQGLEYGSGGLLLLRGTTASDA
jgi:hypothetical protein